MYSNNGPYFTIEISSKLFKGFQYKMHLEQFSKLSSQEVIKEVKNHMKNFFKSYNLYELSEKVDELVLHMHDNLYDPEIIILCDCN
jgi:hypothetical protein